MDRTLVLATGKRSYFAQSYKFMRVCCSLLSSSFIVVNFIKLIHSWIFYLRYIILLPSVRNLFTYGNIVLLVLLECLYTKMYTNKCVLSTIVYIIYVINVLVTWS